MINEGELQPGDEFYSHAFKDIFHVFVFEAFEKYGNSLFLKHNNGMTRADACYKTKEEVECLKDKHYHNKLKIARNTLENAQLQVEKLENLCRSRNIKLD